MLIKAAINGGRTRAKHAPVPITPEEQAAAVIECLAAGAKPGPCLKEALHLGYGLRIGFEDTLQLSDGRLAQSNGELLADALKLVDSFTK